MQRGKNTSFLFDNVTKSKTITLSLRLLNVQIFSSVQYFIF